MLRTLCEYGKYLVGSSLESTHALVSLGTVSAT